MLQLLLTLPSQAVQGKQLLYQLQRALTPPSTSTCLPCHHPTFPPHRNRGEASRRGAIAGPTSFPTRSSAGSSRHAPLACFLLCCLAATAETGEESPSDLQEPGLPGETLQVSSTLGSPCKQPGKGTRPPGLRGSWGSRGLGQAKGSAARCPLWLTHGTRWALVGKHSTSPSPKHQGSACLLHHSLLITLHKERPLLVPGPPGAATRGAGWPIKSSVGLVVPPHPSRLLGSSSWSVHIIPAALSVLALQGPISIHLCSSPPPRLSLACSVPWESRFGLLQHQAERGGRARVIG